MLGALNQKQSGWEGVGYHGAEAGIGSTGDGFSPRVLRDAG